MRLKTLSLIFLLAPAAALSQQKAVPVQLIEAKTVSVVCYGQPCTKPILSAVEKALRKWDRYRVVESGKDADLILSFWIGPAQYGPTHYEVLSPMGSGSTTDIATQQEAGLRLRQVIARVAKETPEFFTRENGKWCAEFRNPISGEFLTVTYSCPTKPVNQAQQN